MTEILIEIADSPMQSNAPTQAFQESSGSMATEGFEIIDLPAPAIEVIAIEDSPPSKLVRKETAQLDLLLLKAESYSKFILENQKRSQAVMQARHTATPTQSKKRASSGSGNASKKARTPEPAPVAAPAQPSFLQPPNMVGGVMMDHQLEGLQWLLSLWENGLNGILADEMGLGKTIQIISLIAHLRYHNTSGPYLIVAPLATLGNWMKEFAKWLPDCPVMLYHGDKPHREQLRKQLPVRDQKAMSFPVVVTSFEIAMGDRAYLERYHWQYLILDEGHRIKNRKCKLFLQLKSLHSTSRLLLSGTPIQNTLEELWSLLNFCSPQIFDDLAVFQSWFDFRNIGHDTQVEDILQTEKSDQIVSKLHEILRPFVLRRLKKDCLAHVIMGKKEVVIYCGMTHTQSEYYARLLDGTLRDTLMTMGVDPRGLNCQLNVMMHQRKVCNHPLLFGDIPGVSIVNDEVVPKALVSMSGKFKLLHRMLPTLRAEKHKVIIFSQMTGVLDLLEDYLQHKDYPFLRFDGSTKQTDRQESIDEFNRPGSDIFIFLLSTRAGGLGVNLTAADTVILFDSDWNPHADLQAQDRCHRIGQTQNVVVYRLLTSGSIEIDMMKKQVSKRKLERLTIQGGDFSKAGRRKTAIGLEELRDLLEDDVKNLSRQESAPAGSAQEWLHKDISDEELELVMNRDCLFADPDSGEDVPVEGEMYDIVTSGGESILQALD